jgi:Zn-finger nucleic acid-binding protein
LRLIACPSCHTQYDVTSVTAERFDCRCGAEVENRKLEAVDARIHRCGSCGAGLSADAESCAYCGSQVERDPGKLSLICPECYARCSEDARFCTACGVPFRPQAVGGEGRELPCPVCDLPMPPHVVGDVGINECRECNGVWVSGGDFDRLVARAMELRGNAGALPGASPAPRVTGANPLRQAVAYRKCPECGAFMQRRNFRKSSGVILDVCHEHGTWLDADELEQIAGFLLSGGTTSPLLQDDPRTRAERIASAEFTRIRHSNRTARDPAEGSLVGSLLDVLTRLLT